MGYEDLNDHEQLHSDPVFGVALLRFHIQCVVDRIAGRRVDDINARVLREGKQELLLRYFGLGQRPGLDGVAVSVQPHICG